MAPLRKNLIGDSWFGSIRAVREVMKKGLYAVMLIKTGSASFPKAAINVKI
jgi:hypothetical protein